MSLLKIHQIKSLIPPEKEEINTCYMQDNNEYDLNKIDYFSYYGHFIYHSTTYFSTEKVPMQVPAILDSGASITILNDLRFFQMDKFQYYTKPRNLGTYNQDCQDSSEGDAIGEGPVDIKINHSKLNKSIIIHINRAIYTPKTRINVLSEGYLQKYLNVDIRTSNNFKYLTKDEKNLLKYALHIIIFIKN